MTKYAIERREPAILHAKTSYGTQIKDMACFQAQGASNLARKGERRHSD